VLSEERDRAGDRDPAVVLGCAIDRLDMSQTVARCRALIERGKFVQQVSINADDGCQARQSSMPCF
jgi:hypothetical protein